MGSQLSQKKRNWIFAAVAIALVALATSVVFYQKVGQPEKITFPAFAEKLEAGQIAEVKIVSSNMLKSRLEGKYVDQAGAAITFTAPVLLQYQTDLQDLLATHGFAVIEQDLGYQGFSFTAFIYIAILLMLGLFMAQVLGLVNLTPGVGHKLRSPQVSFSNVAGVDDAKEEIMEVVTLIKERAKITSLGGTIPKGVLLVGPPGNGKTLLAKAIATEAEIPFFEISGSAFVEKYVGTGAARVRSLFKKARKHAPCIVFIDELDAVGGSRTDSGEGAAREHNQTLNALLVEMDGASGREGVIVVAATNRKESLDPALLRPGRFDRTLHIGLADVAGRREILKVHSRAMKLGSDACLDEIARITSGFSGAELSSLLNEAALIAGRRKAEFITHNDLQKARDRILLGTEKCGVALNDREKWLTAVHEAGHTVVNHFMEHGQTLDRVTIIPRGGALGVTLLVPEEMKYGETRLRLLDAICVLMGGRAAEEIFLGDISSGASGDIGMATRYAKKMVCEWGMSDAVGMVRFEASNEQYLSPQGSSGKDIEEEIRRVINDQYARAMDLIRSRRDKVEGLAQALLEKETLSAKEVEALLASGPATSEPDESATETMAMA